MTSLVNFFGKIVIGTAVLVSDNEFGELMGDHALTKDTIYSSSSLLIHTLAAGEEVYTMTDSGIEKVLTRIK